MRRPQSNRGFTLVELLVVIGIIALLISILLPALNAARRQANQVKCAAQMKQLANAYFLYANDNHGWYPPAKMAMNTGFTYVIGDVTYPFTVSQGTSTTYKVYPFWYDFIAKYVTKTLGGNSAGNNTQMAADSRRTVIWACPAWEGYGGNAYGDLGLYAGQMGIGPSSNMSYTDSYPAYGVDYPSLGNLSVTLRPNGTIFTTDASSATTAYVNGNFPRQVQVSKRGAERLLFADSRYFITESKAPPVDGTFPPQAYPDINTVYSAGINGQTLVDVYRHGRTPSPGTQIGTYAAKGGKVAYNILYCDGHVSGANDQKDAYQAFRMRYPG